MTIVLRNQKAITYNEVTAYKTTGLWIELLNDNRKVVAMFPTETVERVDWLRPCLIRRAKDAPKGKGWRHVY